MGKFVASHGAPEVMGHDIGELEGIEEGQGAGNAGQKPGVAIGPQDGDKPSHGGQDRHRLGPETEGILATWDEPIRTVGPDRIGDDHLHLRKPGQEFPRIATKEGGSADLDSFWRCDVVHGDGAQKVPGGPP